MPFITVKIAGPTQSPEDRSRLHQEITRLMADVLRKKAALTAVAVDHTEAGGWSIGGVPVLVAAHLDATVTAGTNTAAEKAQFIAAAHGLLKSVLGPELPVASYVVIHEVPGDAWGYDGLTQAHRAGR